MAKELAGLVEEGWFTGEPEIVRRAPADLLRRRSSELQKPERLLV